MFTGIVEAVGTVQSLEKGSLRVTRPEAFTDLHVGASVAVSGVCLTMESLDDATMEFHIVPHTLAVTTLGSLRVGDSVNLERAMRADSRFDGHIVQGHVDGIGTIEDITGHGDDVRVVITFDVACAPFIIPQGSVAIDGVSLTIVDVRDQRLTVVLVPQTRSMTTLGSLRKDDRVNIETDVLLRAVVHARDAQ